MNAAMRFIEEHGDTIICEPSGKTYTELLDHKIMFFSVMQKDFMKKKKRRTKKK